MPAYEEQMGQLAVNGEGGKHQVVQAYVTNTACDKIDERSDGSNMKQNMIMAHEEMSSVVKVQRKKAMSVPNIDHKLKSKDRIRM